MSYAANLGRDRIIRLLHKLGASDLEKAIDRAVLQSKIETARMVHELLGSPPRPLMPSMVPHTPLVLRELLSC